MIIDCCTAIRYVIIDIHDVVYLCEVIDDLDHMEYIVYHYTWDNAGDVARYSTT